MVKNSIIITMVAVVVVLSIIIYGKKIENFVCSSFLEKNNLLKSSHQAGDNKLTNDGGMDSSDIHGNTVNKTSNFDAHAPSDKYHFNDTDMDFTFGSLVLGSIINKGAEIGEAFYVSSP